MIKKVLLGIHSEDIRDVYTGFFRLRGLEVYPVQTLDEMVDGASSQEHQIYVMDLNFGSYGSDDIQPARDVYQIIRERVEDGEAKFLGVSGNSRAVNTAKREGIPAAEKGGFPVKNLI